jgi:membrane protein DedA with SNARE-associated domain
LDLQQLIENYGYYAVFAGALLEGETLLVMAGFAVHVGYLQLPPTIACAIAGGFLGDQFCFYMGRRHREFLLRRFSVLREQAPRINRLLARYDVLMIPAVRFLYGLRIAGPAIIGMSEVATWRFMLLNLAGAAVWALLIIAAGYAFGHGLEIALGRLHKHHKLLALGAIAGGGAAYWIYRCSRRR